ncbi:hypothetical protein DB771_02585 [Burkholderia sp. AU29985]|nr:hypothetical protein EGY28_13645 [Burkholderia dolosa]PRE45351.1 hypothetical protein C6P87_21320 [Burkholderia sp. AU12872]PUA78476.1 hypothetical protein DB771_02585 [Burkholderia sp. AU29985]
MGAACATQREILTCAHQPPIRRPTICKQQNPRRLRYRTYRHISRHVSRSRSPAPVVPPAARP